MGLYTKLHLTVPENNISNTTVFENINELKNVLSYPQLPLRLLCSNTLLSTRKMLLKYSKKVIWSSVSKYERLLAGEMKRMDRVMRAFYKSSIVKARSKVLNHVVSKKNSN